MKEKIREPFVILADTFKAFMADSCPRLAAALSYYTVFSLPAVLVLVITIAGAFISPEQITGAIDAQIRDIAGPEAARQVRIIIEEVDRPGDEGPLTSMVSLVALLIGATGAFYQLQAALNQAWSVEPDTGAGWIKNLAIKRVLSFTMIIGVALLLLALMLLSTVVNIVTGELGAFLPEGLSAELLRVANFGLVFLLLTVLFAAIYRILPDAKVAWRDVWVGAFATAFLFVVGNYLFSFYISRSNPGSAYGAAGSLAILLLWIYVSSMILLFGAEFTEVQARAYGKQIVPAKGARRVEGRRGKEKD